MCIFCEYRLSVNLVDVPKKSGALCMKLIMGHKNSLCVHIMHRTRKTYALCMKNKKQIDIQKGLYYHIRNERAGRGAATATMPRPPPLP